MLNGYGIKLRHEYYDEILSHQNEIDWLEILTENYLNIGGYHLDKLIDFSKIFPVTMHGVSMSLGGTDKLDYSYLNNVRNLAKTIKPQIISDHICVSKINGIYTHDLLPLPYTKESIINIVSRIKSVQDYLGCKIAIENVSSYLTYKSSKYTEWEFISEIAEQADCNILLDINNIYVSSKNHDFSPLDYIKNIDLNRIVEIHIAGHSSNGNYLIDTHDMPVCNNVWDLYGTFCKLKPNTPLLLERDENLPKFNILLDELSIAKAIANEYKST